MSRRYVGWMGLALAAGMAAAGPVLAQEARVPLGAENLKVLYGETAILVLFQVESVQGKPEVDQRLPWEVRGPVLEVVKGSLLPGQILLQVGSVVQAFDLKRDDVVGRRFLAPVKPMGMPADRRFQLVGQCAFPADGPEAEALRRLAESDTSAGTGGQGLELEVRLSEKVFPVTGPKTIEIRLRNTGADSATYLQQPILERDGKLYLPGPGMIRVRDLTGRIVPDTGAIVLGQMPPPPPKPALILPKAEFVETLDLGKYFQLSEGRYTLVLTLATPDGRGRVTSNGLSFQVGSVNLPPEPPPVKPVAVTPEAPAPGPGPSAAVSPKLPDPAKYVPGKASAGLAGLLRPGKAVYRLGEPIDLEFRLVNAGPRTLAIDVRLERALTLQVQEVEDSPAPLFVVRQTPWAADGPALPDERSFLREGAFWGRTINLNALFGKTREELIAMTPESVAAGRDVTYERFGKVAYGFPRPGVYNVTATYAVARPPTGEGQPAPKDWWTGELQTNTITIQVGEPEAKR